MTGAAPAALVRSGGGRQPYPARPVGLVQSLVLGATARTMTQSSLPLGRSWVEPSRSSIVRVPLQRNEELLADPAGVVRVPLDRAPAACATSSSSKLRQAAARRAGSRTREPPWGRRSNREGRWWEQKGTVAPGMSQGAHLMEWAP